MDSLFSEVYMITTHIGNIFDEVLKIANEQPDVLHVIVHGCNAQGRMGSGIAKEVRERFPAAYDVYYTEFSTKGLKLGSLTEIAITPNVMLFNAITQQNYGYDGKKYVKYDAVYDAFNCISLILSDELLNEAGLKSYSLNFPLIGAGLAGGNWDVISTIIDTTVPNTVPKNLYKLN